MQKDFVESGSTSLRFHLRIKHSKKKNFETTGKYRFFSLGKSATFFGFKKNPKILFVKKAYSVKNFTLVFSIINLFDFFKIQKGRILTVFSPSRSIDMLKINKQ